MRGWSRLFRASFRGCGLCCRVRPGGVDRQDGLFGVCGRRGGHVGGFGGGRGNLRGRVLGGRGVSFAYQE